MSRPASSASDRKVARALKRLEQLLGRQEGFVTVLSFLTGSIMADKQQITDEIKKLKQAIADDQENDQAVVDALAKTNEALQKTIDDLKSNGADQEAADLEDILTQIKEASASIQPVSTGGSSAPSGETEVPIEP